MNTLSKEIEEARHNVRTDNYPMSIGELANLYEDGELEIHPAFQRVFRWSDEQKSNFIENGVSSFEKVYFILYGRNRNLLFNHYTNKFIVKANKILDYSPTNAKSHRKAIATAF